MGPASEPNVLGKDTAPCGHSCKVVGMPDKESHGSQPVHNLQELTSLHTLCLAAEHIICKPEK